SFNDVELIVLKAVLHVHQALNANAFGQSLGGIADFFNILWAQGHRWQGAGGVTGVNAGFLNVFHYPAEVDIGAVAQGIDVNFNRTIEEAVDQDRVFIVKLCCALDVGLQGGLVVDNFHATAAQDIRRTHENWVANLIGNTAGFFIRACRAKFWSRQCSLSQHLAEFTAVFSRVNCLRAGTNNRNSGISQALCQAQWSLAAELDDDTGNGARFRLCAVDFHDVFKRQRLKVQTIRGVVVSGDGLWVAVDHDGFIALLG